MFWRACAAFIIGLPVLASSAGAQGKAVAQAALKAAGGKAPVAAVRLPKKAYFELGNAYVKFSPEVMRLYGGDLENRFFNSGLDRALYPKMSRTNDGRILNSALSFLKDRELFMKHGDEIAGAIRSRVFAGAVPYKEFLPENAETLYVGEVHGIAGLAREVGNFFRALPSVYPGRKIYLATEFLPAVEDRPFSLDNAITEPRQLLQLTGEDAASRPEEKVFFVKKYLTNG